MTSLAPHTSAIFEPITRLECIKPYVLVGGTALSLQLGTRQSEDLDFMSWRKTKNEKREVDWPAIKKELATVGNVERKLPKPPESTPGSSSTQAKKPPRRLFSFSYRQDYPSFYTNMTIAIHLSFG